jgi:hypothetical protein
MKTFSHRSYVYLGVAIFMGQALMASSQCFFDTRLVRFWKIRTTDDDIADDGRSTLRRRRVPVAMSSGARARTSPIHLSRRTTNPWVHLRELDLSLTDLLRRGL